MSANLGVQFKPTVTKKFAVLNSVSTQPTWEIPQTWNSVLFNQIASTNGQNNTSQLLFPILNCNYNLLLGNCPTVKCTYQATITATNGAEDAALILVNGMAAPNAWPLNKSCQSSIVNLSGQQCLTAVQDFFDVAISSHTDFFTDLTSWSGCVNTIDNMGLGFMPGGGQLGDLASNSVKNVFGDYTTSVYGNIGRLGQSIITQIENPTVNAASAGVASVTWESVEPIFNGVLSFSPKDESCFAGLLSNGSFIQLNLVNLSGNAFKIALPATWTNVSCVVSFTTTPVLQYVLYDAGMELPKISYYKGLTYNNRSQSAPMTIAELSKGVTVSFQDSTINKSIFIYVKPYSAQTKTCQINDAPGFKITQLKFNYGNSQSQFTTFDEYNLYRFFAADQLSIKSYVENGWSSSISATAGTYSGDGLKNFPLYGSVLRIPCELITGYDKTKYGVGSAYLANLQVTVTAVPTYATNATGAPTTAVVYVQCVDESLFQIRDGTLYDLGSNSLITSDVVAMVSKETPTILDRDDGVGSGLFDKIGSLAKKAHAHYQKHKDTYHALANTALEHPLGQKAIGYIANKVGLGGKMHRKRMTHRRGRGLVGSDEEDYSENEMCGGSLISQSEINNRLRNL